MNKILFVLLGVVLSSTLLFGQEVFDIRVEDKVLATVGPDFYGLHFDGPTHATGDEVYRREVTLPGMYGSPTGQQALKAIGTRVVRVFVQCQDVAPGSGVFQWEFVDAAIGQIVDSGMAPMVCLHQGGPAWFVGTSQEPWWRREDGMAAWKAFAKACAARYGDRVRYYEILNEPEHMHQEKENYMTWDQTADCFLSAASAIKEVDADALCGGAATWAAWESGTWASHVLDRPDGERLLDFVSYHIYTSHNLEDPDDAILAKTVWFEESPRYIQSQLAGRTQKRILTALTEFNTSAVFTKDGKPYTDPRDVNAFGGLVCALAYLHSARGGCDLAMHYSTAGGFGLLVWPARYEKQSAYYAVLLLHDVAGLTPGAEVLETTTTEPGKPVASAVRDELTTHSLEPFAVRSEERVAVVLINKRRDVGAVAKVHFPGDTPPSNAQMYCYSSTRIPDAVFPVSTLNAQEGGFVVECPPYSVVAIVDNSH